MKIRVEKKDGWFEFFDSEDHYLSTSQTWNESLEGYEVNVNDSALIRGYYLGQIIRAESHYFFLPTGGIEIIENC